MLLRLIPLIVSSLFFFQTAHAEERTPWNFQGQMPERARAIQITNAQIIPQGLYIQTQTDGYLLWEHTPLKSPTDVITIRASAARPTKASLLWQPKNSDTLVQFYFDIPAGETMHDIDVVLSTLHQWNWRTEKFGIAFPAGSEVLLQGVTFRYWPFYERMMEYWKGFWTFDAFRPYSINFLWGPLLSSNEPQRASMYNELPPPSPSATRVFYGVLIVIGGACLIAARAPWRRQMATGIMLTSIACVWLIFDIRMGSELFSYALHDINSYVLSPEQTFRNYDNVHATILKMKPALAGHATVAMLAPEREVYFPVLRYYAYPTVIRADAETQSGSTAWAVLNRNDVWIDDQSRLRLGSDPANATILTPPGHIAVSVDPSTFLFVVP